MKIISDEKYDRLLEFEKELKEKKQINLVNLKALLKGRDWKDLTDQEKSEISQQIVNLMSQESSKK